DLLDLSNDDKVLEVGTGSGYQAAILAHLVDHVYTIEIVEPLAKSAKKVFDELDYENIQARVGDGYKGWPDNSPFDAIIVTCSPSHIPQPLIDQLAEGGKLIIPVGESYTQELVLVTKKNGKVRKKDVIPVRFVPMKAPSGDSY
ncbi:MAG: protein-L-isoaspartate O-methyltransferase, partial [Cyclobacteriaceae bacterium]